METIQNLILCCFLGDGSSYIGRTRYNFVEDEVKANYTSGPPTSSFGIETLEVSY